MEIAIPLFDRVTALDAVGPYEVLQRLPGVMVRFVGHEVGVVRSENGFLGLTVDIVMEDLPEPDVVIVPGGVGTRVLVDDDRMLSWVRRAHEGSRYTTSVCTGALVVAAAGLLDGLTATTHWAARAELEALGAVAVPDRVVEHLDRRLITAAGVSSGIDMALRLAELLFDADAARAMQLMVEYDPQPPFDSGAPEKVDEAVMLRVIDYASQKN